MAAGASQLTVACALPATAVTPDGAAGGALIVMTKFCANDTPYTSVAVTITLVEVTCVAEVKDQVHDPLPLSVRVPDPLS